jgi:hypothetical protein
MSEERAAMRIPFRSRAFLGLVASALALALSGCTADSPTEPRQEPAPSGGGGSGASGTWNITLTSSRPQVEIGTGRSSNISIRARNAANNALPPEGAVVTVTTTLGELGTQGSGATAVAVALTEGFASVALFAGDEEGTAVVTARLEQSIGQINVPIVPPAVPIDTPVPDVFFLERVEPDEGSPDGGELVRILGQEISEPVRVFFGGNPAEVVSVSATAIRVRTPRNDSVPPPPAVGRLAVDVAVTINANQANEESDTLVAGFTYARGDVGVQPVIFSVTPNVGANEGGTRVTINGDGFQSPVQVLFSGGSPLTSLEAQIESVSRTQVVVRSPAATGFGAALKNETVDIVVRNLGNGLEATRADAFTYGVTFAVFGIDPSSGPFTGGTRVTIFGEGFDEPLVVDFGDLRQQVLSVTGTEILVRTVPLRFGAAQQCEDASLPVLVTHLETNQTATGPDFTYLVENLAPTISSTSPGTLTQNPGAVTINGNNFRQPVEVTFNARPVIVTSVSNSQIVGTFPAIPNGDLDEDDCNDNGDTQIGHRFANTALELEVIDLTTGCSDTLSVTVIPSNTTCRDDLAPTPVPAPTVAPTPTP